MGVGQDGGELSRACLSEVPNSRRDEWRLLTGLHARCSCPGLGPLSVPDSLSGAESNRNPQAEQVERDSPGFIPREKGRILRASWY